MGVVQNSIDIQKIIEAGGDPEIAAKVQELEAEIGDENSGIIKDIDDLQEANALVMTSVSSIKGHLSSGYIITPTLYEVEHIQETSDTVEHILSAFMTKVAAIGSTLADDEAVLFTDFVLDGYEMKPCGESTKIVTAVNLTTYLNALRVGGFAKIVLDGSKVQIITAMARLSISSGYYIVQTVSSDSTQNLVVKHAPSDTLSGSKTFKCHYYKVKTL